MPRPAKSQWDFGELFPSADARRPLTVSELTAQVKRLVERQVGQVWVTGEVTNFRAQSSGHCYFTLKDATTQLACVLFRGHATAQRGLLQDGQKVVLRGDVTVYEARGQYQLLVREIELQGVGALQAAFDRLKQKLAAEGLFAQERKRPLPEIPQRIGLVTSPTGAAIRDVLHVIARRQPALEITLAPCRVQGEGAAQEVAAAIALLNEWHAKSPLDLILVTRGGGSLEDLWAFNEEAVARAIAASVVPVVSAIGHEIDFTIADFVADLRAATPSAAAELITEGAFSNRQFVADAESQLAALARRRLRMAREHLDSFAHRLGLAHPRRRLEDGAQRLDDLRDALALGLRHQRERRHTTARELHSRLARLRPGQIVARRAQHTGEVHRRLRERVLVALDTRRLRHATASARLKLLSPENVLARGYSITTDATSGRVLRDATSARAGQRLRTRLHQGEVSSVVEG
jgi:exodeoxyribonuclease VII large subunit